MRPLSRIRTFVVAGAAAALVAATTAAGAATGPVFSIPTPATGPSDIGVTYPVSVSGTYVPLAMDCLGEKRVLWYAPGAASDTLWRNVTFPATGSPTFTSVTVSVTGTYQPFTGDFDGDGCEDVFWYAPGAAIDPVWYFAADGSHTSLPESVTGDYRPVVGSFAPGAPDDIFWFGGAAANEVIWTGGTVRGSFTSTAAPQYTHDAQAVLAAGSSNIYLDAPGTTNDRLLSGVVAGSTTVSSNETVTSADGATWRNLGGMALRYVPGLDADALVTGVRRTTFLCPVGTTCPPPSVSFATAAAVFLGTFVVSNSTARAGFGVLHAPGAAADAFVIPNQSGVYRRQPAAVGGGRPNNGTRPFGITPDGTKVLLQSAASNLVAGDTNGQADVFVWDRTAGTYQRQPLGVGGAQPNASSDPIGISADGTAVLLVSSATNLVAGDTNGHPDVFVWSRTTNTYQRQPLGVGGAQPNAGSYATALTPDGTKVLVYSAASNLVAGDTNGQLDAVVWDRTTNTYQRQPAGLAGAQPNGTTIPLAVTPDGTKIVMSSASSNLVAGDTNAQPDVFIWNRSTGTYQRQPNGLGGAEPNGRSLANAVSADGSKVLITSLASNLRSSDTNGVEDVFVWNVGAGYVREPLAVNRSNLTAAVQGHALSFDGTKVLLSSTASNLVEGDTNGVADVFLWNLTNGTVVRQPLRADARQPASPSLPGGNALWNSVVMTPDASKITLVTNDTLLDGPPANVPVGSVDSFETFVWDRTPF